MRASVHMVVFVIRPLDNGCEVAYIADSDPRGRWVDGQVKRVHIR